MQRKCDKCNREAVVHEVTVRNNVKREVHLCEQHAKQAGIQLPGQQPLNQILTQFVISQSGRSPRLTNKACPGCGLSFADFRNKGRLGCPECYQAFESELSPLIERTQNGGSSHCGKSPRRSAHAPDRQALIQRLLKELDHAVAAEQYERAAKLRDELNNMEVRTRSTGAQASRDQPRS